MVAAFIAAAEAPLAGLGFIGKEPVLALGALGALGLGGVGKDPVLIPADGRFFLFFSAFLPGISVSVLGQFREQCWKVVF